MKHLFCSSRYRINSKVNTTNINNNRETTKLIAKKLAKIKNKNYTYSPFRRIDFESIIDGFML